MTHTLPMFTAGEDLPLFTGQPVSIQQATFQPKTYYRQLRLQETSTMTGKTYQVTVDPDTYLALASNATIVDQEDGDDGTTTVFVRVTRNYTRFEQQLDTTAGVWNYMVVKDDTDD